MKKFLIALAALALAGCGSFGHTAYSVTANATGGCDLDAKDGKEYAGDGRSIMFDGKRCQLAVGESASKAFKGQAIGAKAVSVLPVTNLQELVK